MAKKQRYVSKKAKRKKIDGAVSIRGIGKKGHIPKRFPFWARLRIEKRRPVLVVDKDVVFDKQKKKLTDGYIVRQVQHPENTKNCEKIYPNPNPKDPEPMYLRRATKYPKHLISDRDDPDWFYPSSLKDKYSKNNIRRFRKKK